VALPMIITQTPLRISFLGGGSDFPDFYASEPGCVLSATIDKYVNVIAKQRFDDLIRVGYTKQEVVESVDELEHELVREAMRITGIEVSWPSSPLLNNFSCNTVTGHTGDLKI